MNVRASLSRRVELRHKSRSVIEALLDHHNYQGISEHIHSDNGSEFTASAVRKWLGRLGVRALFIEPGSPWEHGYIESFSAR
jgi:putative transposase